MGQPVAVIEKQTSREGYVRFETNRSFTGMGHERYLSQEDIVHERPADVIARVLFETGQVDQVHVYAQAVTVRLAEDQTSRGLKDILANVYIHYKPGVAVPTAEDFA